MKPSGAGRAPETPGSASLAGLDEALATNEGALILVSRDRRFLDRLTIRRWALEPDTPSRVAPGEG